jgi:hypothetical protein
MCVRNQRFPSVQQTICLAKHQCCVWVFTQTLVESTCRTKKIIRPNPREQASERVCEIYFNTQTAMPFRISASQNRCREERERDPPLGTNTEREKPCMRQRCDPLGALSPPSILFVSPKKGVRVEDGAGEIAQEARRRDPNSKRFA